jgi:hypothetical protein
MSLINDALKRARQAQQPHAPDAPQLRVQFRPVEPAQQPKKKNTALWVAVVVVGVLAIGFVFRQLTRENGSGAPKEAKAREIVPAKPIPQQTQAPPAPPTNTSISNVSEIASHDPSVPAPVVDEVPAKPAPKLQAVIFDPRRPSAIISGKSVFIGDKLGDLRVVAITRESATLIGGGQTNLLVLGE